MIIRIAFSKIHKGLSSTMTPLTSKSPFLETPLDPLVAPMSTSQPFANSMTPQLASAQQPPTKSPMSPSH